MEALYKEAGVIIAKWQFAFRAIPNSRSATAETGSRSVNSLSNLSVAPAIHSTTPGPVVITSQCPISMPWMAKTATVHC